MTTEETKKPTADGSNWTTARIFISSTFRDMYDERELIVKHVLPELAEWAEKRGVRIIECDLRWGVPKASTAVETIEACLGELERIKHQSNNQPLFLCLLGDRYGWVPELKTLPEDLTERYSWVDDGISITHMEILQGFIRCKNQNALFCFRSSELTSELPSELLGNFLDSYTVEREQLRKLVAANCADDNQQIICYRPIVQKSSSSVHFNFEPDFATKITDFFKQSIERLFPGRDEFKAPDTVQQESFAQTSFVRRQCSSLYGVGHLVEELTDLLLQKALEVDKQADGKASSFGPPCSFATVFHELTDLPPATLVEGRAYQAKHWPFGCTSWTSRPYCLCSPPGYGKTSLLCAVVDSLDKDSEKCVAVFHHLLGIAVSDESMSCLIFLQRLNAFLRDKLATGDEFQADNIRDEELKLNKLLERLSNHPELHVIIIIDAIEQFYDVAHNFQVDWSSFLPARFPCNCTVLFSTASDLDDRYKWIYKYCLLSDAILLQMPPTSEVLRTKMVTEYFRAYNKKLDAEQLTLLVNNEGAKTALWLRLACEELRIFGVFEEVTARISQLDNSLHGILLQIVSRLMAESPSLPVKRLLAFLAVSPKALPEKEMPLLLTDFTDTSAEPIAPLDVTRLIRLLKPFLLESRTDFSIKAFHTAMLKAARKLCLPSKADVFKYKKLLATFLMTRASNDTKASWACAVLDLLWESNNRQELLDYLRFHEFGRIFTTGWKQIFIQKCRCFMRPFDPQAIPCLVCMACSNKFDHTLRGRVVDFCWICKERLFRDSKPAKMCSHHPEEFRLGQANYSCRICKTFWGPHYQQWTQLLTCQQCSFSELCCVVSEEVSIKRHALFPLD